MRSHLFSRLNSNPALTWRFEALAGSIEVRIIFLQSKTAKTPRRYLTGICVFPSQRHLRHLQNQPSTYEGGLSCVDAKSSSTIPASYGLKYDRSLINWCACSQSNNIGSGYQYSQYAERDGKTPPLSAYFQLSKGLCSITVLKYASKSPLNTRAAYPTGSL